MDLAAFRGQQYRYTGIVRRPYDTHVYDGDTFTVDLDLGLDVHWKHFRVRPIGYDAPEMKGPDRLLALGARDHLIELFETVRGDYGEPLVAIETVKNSQSFERYLCHVWLPDSTGLLRPLPDLMIASGLCAPRS